MKRTVWVRGRLYWRAAREFTKPAQRIALWFWQL